MLFFECNAISRAQQRHACSLIAFASSNVCCKSHCNAYVEESGILNTGNYGNLHTYVLLM